MRIVQLSASRDKHKKRADKHKRKRKHAERKYKRLVEGWNRKEAKIITRELNKVCKAVRKEVGDWHDVKLVPLRPNIIADPSEVYKTMFMRTKRPAAVIPIPRGV